MNRRKFTQSALALLSAASAPQARAALSGADASAALQESLRRGAEQAIAQLGVSGGFTNNEKVRIPLPDLLEKAAPTLKMFGQSKRLDELRLTLNRAAEQAIPLAKPLVSKAINGLDVHDAKRILTGGDTSVTDFFDEKVHAELAARFRPEVAKVTQQLGVARQYDRLLSKGRALGVKAQDLDAHVTERAIKAFFVTLAEQEKALRANPLQAGSSLLKRVFAGLN